MKKYKLYIDGKWAESSIGKSYDVLNPATEEVVAEVAEGSVENAKNAIDAAREAFDRYKEEESKEHTSRCHEIAL